MSRTQFNEATGELTKSQRDVLRRLHVREFYGPERPCWLVDLPRNVFLLLVPVDFAPVDTNGTFRGRPTLSALHSRGLIEYGPNGYLPDEIAARSIAYARRMHIKSSANYGSTVALTEAGRALFEGPRGGDQ